MSIRHLFAIPAAFAVLASCSRDSTSPNEEEICTGYGEWSTSLFVLPYPAGTSYGVIQGNCSPPGNGHRGANRYAYDFGMPVGSVITAVRAGTVVDVEESHTDGQIAASGLDNYLVIRHTDGSTALYGHITHDGASVGIGDVVAQGQ
ncbi:MAG: M23 family metallopeptidase, partial [Gemmatimonadaceae bacterium]